MPPRRVTTRAPTALAKRMLRSSCIDANRDSLIPSLGTCQLNKRYSKLDCLLL
jgi:hypothetical protein